MNRRSICLVMLLVATWLGLIATLARADDPNEPDFLPFPGPQSPPGAPPGPGDPLMPPGPPPCGTGDPIYPNHGDFLYTQEIVSIPGKAMPVTVTMRYWSQREQNGNFGYNWFMCYHVRLVAFADNSIEVIYGCGGRYNYQYDSGSASYIPPPGTYAELVSLGGTGFTLTQTDGTVYTFDTDGKVTSIADLNGHEITFDYDNGGALPIVGETKYVVGTPTAQTLARDWRLSTITDTKGDDIDFAYDTNGRLHTVADYSGRTWAYAYNTSDDLISITTPAITGFASGLVTQFGYDSSHHMLTVTDPENHTRVTNTFYSSGRLATQTYGTGTMTLTYNDASHTTTVVDGEGYTSTWTYNSEDLLTSRKAYTADLRPGDPDYYETDYSYTSNNELARATYPRGNAIEYTYDNRGNVTEKRRKRIGVSGDDPTDIVTTGTYQTNSDRITSFSDAESHTRGFAYDTSGNLTQITYPAVGGQSPVVTIARTTDGQLELVTDPNGDELKYEYYTGTGYIHKVRLDPDGINATFELVYDNVGNVTSIKDARNKTTAFSYNALNWLTAETNALGYQTKYTYDGNGNIKKIERQSNAGGTTWQTTQYTYTTANLLKTITNPLGKVTTYNYDDNNDLSSVVDAKSNTTSYAYDERNLLWKVTNALNKVTEYGYDNNGNLETLKDADQHVTTYRVDDFDRLIRRTYHDGSFERIHLRRTGRIDSVLVNTELKARYRWDAIGRLASIKYSPADSALYVYDLGSRIIKAKNNVSKIGLLYDALGRIDADTTETGAHTYIVNYDYDNNSNRTNLTYPSGYSIDFGYTDINQLSDVQRSGDALVHYDYDTLGRRSFREIIPETRFIQTFYEYDGASRTTRILNKTLKPSAGEEQPEPTWSMRGIWQRFTNWTNGDAWAGTGVTLSDFGYTYDDVGNRLTMSVDGGTRTYGYDDIYQLTSVSGAQSHSYSYDDVGNRASSDSKSYTPNSLNQYTEVDNVDFDNDASGNLTDDGVNTYEYDNENRLESVTAGSTTVTYAYDPFGRRQLMSVNGTDTYFVYDGDRLLAEYDGSGNLQREYVYGANLDEVVSLLKAPSPSARYFYYQDALGSVSEILDFNGLLKERYRYAPYGKTTIKNASGTTLTTSLVGNRFAFTGRWLDYETALYDFRARVYSVEIGRFSQRDPLGEIAGTNLYTYAMNSPTNYFDPMGTEAWTPLFWLPVRLSGWQIIKDDVSAREAKLPQTADKNAFRHYEAAREICSEYGPLDAAAASIGQEFMSFGGGLWKWGSGNGFDWTAGDTWTDFHNDYLGLKAGRKP